MIKPNERLEGRLLFQEDNLYISWFKFGGLIAPYLSNDLTFKVLLSYSSNTILASLTDDRVLIEFS